MYNESVLPLLFDIAKFYNLQPVFGRVPCFIHGGESRNMKLFDDGYTCFVCGKKGTRITFVMELFKLTYSEAIKKLEHDFGIKAGEGQIALSVYFKQKIENDKLEAWRKSYVNTFSNIYKTMHTWTIENAPKNEIMVDTKYIYALHEIIFITYIIDMLTESIKNYDKIKNIQEKYEAKIESYAEKLLTKIIELT
jgi:hypothetical protein